MKLTRRTANVAALCVGSAVLGGALSLTTIANAGPSGQHDRSTSAHSHRLVGGYILADGKCPKGTVGVNAQVKAETNSPSGHSEFTLCYIKK